MIKKVAIQNFQIHKETELEFKEGMNVIAGSSDNGKSSIIRAIRWVLMNRPTGFAFHTHGAKDDTAVCIVFGDYECVTRRKGEKNTGGYHYRQDTFAALRTDVPPEIQRVLNLSDINIQSQHDPYFLLQDSPGEVAKKLNVVAGLGIIGDTIKKANNVVRDRKEAVGNLVKQEADYKAMFDKYSWAYEEQDNVFQLQLDVQRYKRIRDDIEAIKQGMDRREALLRKCKTISDSIGEHKAEYEQLRQEFEKINQLGCRIHELSSLAYSFRVKSRAMKAAKRLASMRQSFEAVRDTLDNYYKNRTAWGSIKRLCEWHFTAALDKAKAKRQIDRGKADLELFKAEHPLCPTCNRPWEE
jgi:exonuclease SbcC